MFQLRESAAISGGQSYDDIASQLAALLDGEHDHIANAANFSSLLYHSLANLNWAGFYFMKDGELVVGPFQGKPACTRIALGRGVCGTAAESRRTIVVEDVELFPGHIACDAASRSEIVVPLLWRGVLLGVLDLDSPVAGRFTDDDSAGLQMLVELFLRHTPM